MRLIISTSNYILIKNLGFTTWEQLELNPKPLSLTIESSPHTLINNHLITTISFQQVAHCLGLFTKGKLFWIVLLFRRAMKREHVAPPRRNLVVLFRLPVTSPLKCHISCNLSPMA